MWDKYLYLVVGITNLGFSVIAIWYWAANYFKYHHLHMLFHKMSILLVALCSSIFLREIWVLIHIEKVALNWNVWQLKISFTGVPWALIFLVKLAKLCNDNYSKKAST